MSDQQDIFYTTMERTLYLSDEDLDANREGIVSPNQRARIFGQIRSATLGVGCIIVFSLLPALAIIFLVNDPVVRIIAILVIVFSGLTFRNTYKKISARGENIAVDLDKGVAGRVQGMLTKKETDQRAGYYLGADDTFFLVPKAMYEAAPDSGQVAIYYLPTSKQFLSLEFLDHTSNLINDSDSADSL